MIVIFFLKITSFAGEQDVDDYLRSINDNDMVA